MAPEYCTVNTSNLLQCIYDILILVLRFEE